MRLMWRMRADEVADQLIQDRTVLLPVGSTEQHGDHLPVGTDALVAIRLAEDVSERTGTIVAPPIWFGFTPQHMSLAGTVTVRAETLIALVEDVCTSLLYHGYEKIVIINGHRLANLPPLQIAASRVHTATGGYVGIVDPVHVGRTLYAEMFQDPAARGVSHADGTETAHMLYLHPTLVAMDRIKDVDPSVPHHRPPLDTTDPLAAADRVISMKGPADAHPSGVVPGANPSWGTEARGRALHTGVVDRIVGYLDQLASFDIGPIDRSFNPMTR